MICLGISNTYKWADMRKLFIAELFKRFGNSWENSIYIKIGTTTMLQVYPEITPTFQHYSPLYWLLVSYISCVTLRWCACLLEISCSMFTSWIRLQNQREKHSIHFWRSTKFSVKFLMPDIMFLLEDQVSDNWQTWVYSVRVS